MKAVPIGEVTDRVSTWNPTREPETQFTYVDLSAVDNAEKSIVSPVTMTGGEAPSRARQLIRTDDILVSTVRPNLNAVALVGPELDGATASTGFTVLRPANRVDADYLFHWVRTPQFVSDMVRRATGASYPAVSDRIVKEALIPLPPIDEQRRIAAILIRAERIRSKRRRSLQQLTVLSTSLFFAMFGDPAVSDGRYPVVPLAELIQPDRPITYGILKPGPHIEDGIPYVRVADMKGGGIDLRGVRRTTRKIAGEYKRSTLRSGDLLMSIRGHVGRFAFVPHELDGANITQDSARVAVSESASPVYIRVAMEMPGLQQWMVRHTKGVAVRGINLGDLKRLPIPCPPLVEQQEFSAAVTLADEQRSAALGQLNLLDEVFSSIQYRAFSGQL